RLAHQLGVLEGTCEVEVIGTTFCHGDAHPVAIDVSDGAQRRTLRYQVSALDHHIGRRKVYPGSAYRIDGEERNVPELLLERLKNLASSIENHIVDADAKTARQFAREFRGHTARRAACGVLLGQHRVAEVNGRAQSPVWGEFGYEFR